jgi:hypothetical protein
MSNKSPDTSAFSKEQLEATADDAVTFASAAGEQAANLVAAWVAAGNGAAVSEVAEGGAGSARKAARRGLNVLKSRGVTVERRPRTTSIATSAKAEVKAWMLPANAQGVVILVVAEHSPTSRSRVCVVQLRDRIGIMRLENATVSGSSLSKKLKEMTGHPSLSPVEVPVEWVRARIAAARAKHQTNGVPEPLGFDTAADLLNPIPETQPDHPFDEEGLVIADEDADELAKESARLHQLPEFNNWLPPKPAVEEVLYKVGESLPAGEQPSQEVITEKITAEIHAATDRYFSPQAIEELVEMMKDSALSVLNREGESKALEVVGTMKVVQRCGLITNPPQENGFLRGFFEKGIQALAMQTKGELKIPMPSGVRMPEVAPEAMPEAMPEAAPAPAADK